MLIRLKNRDEGNLPIGLNDRGVCLVRATKVGRLGFSVVFGSEPGSATKTRLSWEQKATYANLVDPNTVSSSIPAAEMPSKSAQTAIGLLCYNRQLSGLR